jgi:hypothetical protein
MRVVSKNELLLLLGSCTTQFATFCLSPPGAVTKFLFDNTTGFDLDSELVAGLIAGLHQGGIVDDAAVVRLVAFGVPEPSGPAPVPVVTYAYQVPYGYPEPAGLVRSIVDVTLSGRVVIVSVPIADGIAVEVSL